MNKILGLLLLLVSTFSFAADKTKTIAVLDFELTDLTISVDAESVAAENERTQSIKPILVKALQAKYKIINIDKNLQDDANHARDYIFDNPDVAAELGQKVGVDYIIVGRLHKPSYLFAYLIVRVVDVKKAKLLAQHVVEAKGRLLQSTRTSIPSLASKIIQTINKI